jgi:DNA-binding response OmpR family regulator
VRVLIVDDNIDSADSLRMLLARAGHEVRTVGQGALALPAAAEFGPELVVLDIGLPDIDGYTVAQRLRGDERTRNAVLIAVTGYGRDEDRARSSNAGIDMHITKPVDPDALMRHFAALQERAGQPSRT